MDTDQLDGLYESLILLCEVRGELSPEQNEHTEARILETKKKIKELENVSRK